MLASLQGATRRNPASVQHAATIAKPQLWRRGGGQDPPAAHTPGPHGSSVSLITPNAHDDTHNRPNDKVMIPDAP